MQYQVYNTGDQVWIDDQEVIRLHTNDGLYWSNSQSGLTKTSGLFHVTENGDKIWFGTRYGHRVVTKFVSYDGLVWSEDDSFRKLAGVEKAIHQVEVFFTKIILQLLS